MSRTAKLCAIGGRNILGGFGRRNRSVCAPTLSVSPLDMGATAHALLVAIEALVVAATCATNLLRPSGVLLQAMHWSEQTSQTSSGIMDRKTDIGFDSSFFQQLQQVSNNLQLCSSACPLSSSSSNLKMWEGLTNFIRVYPRLV